MGVHHATAGDATALQAIFFSLTALHAMLAGRRTLGRMGWNEQYAFAPSELAIAEHYLQMLLGLYNVAGGGQQAAVQGQTFVCLRPSPPLTVLRASAPSAKFGT